MALKLPGVTDRIKDLYEQQRAGRSMLRFGQEVEIYQQKLRDWLTGTQPDFPGLLLLEKAFGVPWQWILIGDEGYAAIRAYKERGEIRDLKAVAPRERQKSAGARRAARAR